MRKTQLISLADTETAPSPNKLALLKNTSTTYAPTPCPPPWLFKKSNMKRQLMIQCKWSFKPSTNNWLNPATSEYKKVSGELSVHKGIILRGHGIVMSLSLRRRTINFTHIGHQEIIKTKRLLRSKVWFPNIDTMVEETIRDCLPCQAATSGNHPPPETL